MLYVFPFFFWIFIYRQKIIGEKIPDTPFIDSIFLIKSFEVCDFSLNSTGPDNETFSPGRNFSELGFGVFKSLYEHNIYINRKIFFKDLITLKTNDFFLIV